MFALLIHRFDVLKIDIDSFRISFFIVVFFYGVTMQALGNGAMAGLMANGRLSSGFKHAGMMLVLAILSFTFISFIPELIGVPISPGLNPSIGMLRIT